MGPWDAGYVSCTDDRPEISEVTVKTITQMFFYPATNVVVKGGMGISVQCSPIVLHLVKRTFYGF